MFNVEYKGKIYPVYGVRTDTFLLWINGLWTWVYMHDCTLVECPSPKGIMSTWHE